MSDIFERYFNLLGATASDYYSLERLDPSYRIYWDDTYNDVPADYGALKELFESIEPGSAAKLDLYLKEAALKYEVGIRDLVFRPGLSFTEFMNLRLLISCLKLKIFSSLKAHVASHFTSPRLRQLMEFPSLFLGALPEKTPALYSLMNYADIQGGTWYPAGGMYSVVTAMYDLAVETGVTFRFGEEVLRIDVRDRQVTEVQTVRGSYKADVVVSGADYHFTENALLPPGYQSYSSRYWNKKVLAPSAIMYYVGINKKLRNFRHHSLFFDESFSNHGRELYTDPAWPSAPLFYVNASSVTDPSVSPPGHENLVMLVPVASGLEHDDEKCRERYFTMILNRMEKHTGQNIRDNIVYKKAYSVTDFKTDYHSFKGNAYGLANTLLQTAIMKPKCRSRKLSNLFYTGQLTVPGPGVPPSLISGEIVAKQVLKNYVKA
jgi:phytoene desaturase